MWSWKPIHIFRASMEPDNVVLKTNSYFQGQHRTWQCGPGNQFLFSGPSWNLTMWSQKPIPIFRASMEPENVVPETYSYFQGNHWIWQYDPRNLLIFAGLEWKLTMWSQKPIPIFRSSMEPEDVVPETYSLKGIRSILSPDILHTLATCGWKVLSIFIKKMRQIHGLNYVIFQSHKIHLHVKFFSMILLYSSTTMSSKTHPFKKKISKFYAT